MLRSLCLACKLVQQVSTSTWQHTPNQRQFWPKMHPKSVGCFQCWTCQVCRTEKTLKYKVKLLGVKLGTLYKLYWDLNILANRIWLTLNLVLQASPYNHQSWEFKHLVVRKNEWLFKLPNPVKARNCSQLQCYILSVEQCCVISCCVPMNFSIATPCVLEFIY